MKVLFLVQDEQRVVLDRLYEAVCEYCKCDLRRISSRDQADLAGYFAREVEVEKYDRILFFLRFKKELQQIDFIRSIPNLVTLEHDACQNYAPGKYRGRFSYYYKSIPWIRVICSGYGLAQRLRQEGVDAICVPKGYDKSLHCDMGLERDVELGFLGSLGAATYAGRKALLEELMSHENLHIARASPGAEYRDYLNRIRFFVSADVGFGEYMIKNFEAMACGCVLLTYDQGEQENRSLGFRDMENVVLYRTVDELRGKLAKLRASSELANNIARNGRALVESNYSFAELGRQLVEAMQPQLLARQGGQRKTLDILRLRWKLHTRRWSW